MVETPGYTEQTSQISQHIATRGIFNSTANTLNPNLITYGQMKQESVYETSRNILTPKHY